MAGTNMPSYKHKKRKKSNKYTRKHSFSGSSQEESDNGLGRIRPFHSDSDDSSNEDILSSLVRRSYVDHLRKALKENLNLGLKDLDKITSESVEELASKWTSVLENKALRTCMMSIPYRQSMVALIKKVKSDTVNKRLTVEDLPHLKLKLPLNKDCQTTFCRLSSAGTQTEKEFGFLKEISTPDRPYDPAIVFSDSPTANDNVTSSQLLESCNISSTSDLFDNIKTTDLTNALNILGILPAKFDGTAVKISDSSNEKQNSDLLQKNISEPMSSFVKRRESIEKIVTKKDNLDIRLNALGFTAETNDEIDVVSNKLISSFKKSNWFAEEIAQSCNLTRNLLRLSVRKRERVLKRIKELFGENNEVLSELTEKNIAVCRKRIATVVVMELTPIYQDKRIASRRLFKFLAKKITKSLMENSLAPETRNIRYKVKEFFNDGRIIMSESDCN